MPMCSLYEFNISNHNSYKINLHLITSLVYNSTNSWKLVCALKYFTNFTTSLVGRTEVGYKQFFTFIGCNIETTCESPLSVDNSAKYFKIIFFIYKNFCKKKNWCKALLFSLSVSVRLHALFLSSDTTCFIRPFFLPHKLPQKLG